MLDRQDDVSFVEDNQILNEDECYYRYDYSQCSICINNYYEINF